MTCLRIMACLRMQAPFVFCAESHKTWREKKFRLQYQGKRSSSFWIQEIPKNCIGGKLFMGAICKLFPSFFPPRKSGWLLWQDILDAFAWSYYLTTQQTFLAMKQTVDQLICSLGDWTLPFSPLH